MPKRSTLRLTKRIVDRLSANGKDAIFSQVGTFSDQPSLIEPILSR